jgi:hypothetical protein
MRLEYIEAVDAVRWGWLGWFQLAAPAVLIWLLVFRYTWKPFRVALVVASCVLSSKLMVLHSNSIQHAKKIHASTDVEWRDVARDTWNTMAPGTSIIWSIIYCGLLYGAANATRAVVDWRRELRVANHAA